MYLTLTLQSEKRKMLMEHETQKIKEMDEQYQCELREWKNHLRPRKQVRRAQGDVAGYRPGVIS